MTDALATVTAALVRRDTEPHDPRRLRTGLRQHVLPPPARELARPNEIDEAIEWLKQQSIPL